MQLADTLGRLLLKCRRARREVRILVAEELVGDLAREQHTQVGLLMDGLADEVHTDARTDGRDVIRAEQRHDLRQRLNHILARDDDLGVVGVQILRHLAGIFQVDGVAAHADGKCADGLFEQLCRDCAHEAAVQAAGEQEAERRVGIEPLLHAGDELFADVRADSLQIILADGVDLRHVAVAGELTVGIIVTGRKRHHIVHETDKVFRLAGKDDRALGVVAVVQRADADGVARRDKTAALGVIDDHGKLCVETAEHVQPLAFVEREQDLTVGFALERLALGDQPLTDGTKTVDLTVAHERAAITCERLHAFRMQPHDGQPVKAERRRADVQHARIVRAAGNGLVKAGAQILRRDGRAEITDDGTHDFFLLNTSKNTQLPSDNRTSSCVSWCHLFYFSRVLTNRTGITSGFDGAPTEALARSDCSSGVFFTQALLCGSHRPALAGNDRPCYFSPSMLLTEV